MHAPRPKSNTLKVTSEAARHAGGSHLWTDRRQAESKLFIYTVSDSVCVVLQLELFAACFLVYWSVVASLLAGVGCIGRYLRLSSSWLSVES